MEKGKLQDEAIRIVFKYLNGNELQNTSSVCKSWREIGQNECTSRRPMTYVKTIERVRSKLDTYSVNKDIIECYLIKPSLYMYFTNYDYSDEFVKKCHCHLLPPDCYSLSLKNNFLKDDKDTLSCMIFPDASNVRVFTYSFTAYSYEEKLYYPELVTDFDSKFLQDDNWRHKLEPFLDTTHASTCFMIILSNMIGLYTLRNEVDALLKWFPRSRIPFWGGVVDVLSVCNLFPFNRKCNLNADTIHIIINGQDMAMWSLALDDNHKTKKALKEKLDGFKQDVNLKLYSIAFICTPAPRYMKLYKFESNAFKKAFPDVQLIHIYGHVAFGGNGFTEFRKKIHKNLPIEDEDASTSIVILTYN